MNIGNFQFSKDSGVYIGDVTTLSFHRTGLMFRPVEKSSDKEPDFRVVAQGAFGFVEFGSAWKRTSEKGKDYLSVELDDPTLPQALYAALFPSKDGKTAALVWSRQKKASKEAKVPTPPKPAKKAA